MTLFAVGAFESFIYTVPSAREWDICDSVKLIVFISSVTNTLSSVPFQTAFLFYYFSATGSNGAALTADVI